MSSINKDLFSHCCIFPDVSLHPGDIPASVYFFHCLSFLLYANNSESIRGVDGKEAEGLNDFEPL